MFTLNIYSDIYTNDFFMCLQVLEAMKVIYVGVRMTITKGWRKVGKKLIGSCIGIVRNTGMEPRLQNHLTEHGLPTNYEDIPSDESADSVDAAMNEDSGDAAMTEDCGASQNVWDQNVSTEHVGPSYVHEVYFTKSIKKSRQNLGTNVVFLN